MFHQGVRILTPWFHLYLASENGNVSKVGGFFCITQHKKFISGVALTYVKGDNFSFMVTPKVGGYQNQSEAAALPV